MTTLPLSFAALPARRVPSVGSMARVLVLVLGMAMLSGAVLVAATGLRLEAAGFARFAGLAGAMGLLAAWCRHRKLDPRMTDAAAIVGAGTISLMLCGVVANAGLRLRLPLADPQLARADAALGFHADAVIRAVAERPVVGDVLSALYNTSGVAVVALVAVAILRGRLGRAWELTATAIIAMQAVAVLSPLLPAWGAMRHFGLIGLQEHGLPAGAGIYQWPAFTHFYVGSDPVLRLADMGGVVAFPSFHTVLALMLTQALCDTRWRWPAICWTAGIILSAIPMGGHYVADLVAGVLVWITAVTLARRAALQ